MSDQRSAGHRTSRLLSPEVKWEIFLKITSGEITQAEAARRLGVDVSTIITIRRTVRDAALAALAARPGRPRRQHNLALEAAQREIAQLTEAVKSQAIELVVLRGKADWA